MVRGTCYEVRGKSKQKMVRGTWYELRGNSKAKEWYDVRFTGYELKNEVREAGH